MTSFYSSVFPEISFTGMDISRTAVDKASRLFLTCDFVCDSIGGIRDFSTYHGGTI